MIVFEPESEAWFVAEVFHRRVGIRISFPPDAFPFNTPKSIYYWRFLTIGGGLD